VRNATTTYPDSDAEEGSEDDKRDKSNTGSTSSTSEELEKLKKEHQREMEQLQIQHEEEVALIRSDFTLVISTLKQGSSSDTIMDLQAKVNEHDEEVEKLRKSHSEEVEELETKLKRVESSSFYATRRQEEMGCKIYNMQNELDEMEYKHQMEIKTYQEKLAMLTGGSDNEMSEYNTEIETLREKNKLIEVELSEVRTEHEHKIEAIELKLQDEKRKEISELMDKVWKLEALIDEMKETHHRDLTAFEKTDREEKQEAQKVEETRVKDLEAEKQTLKKEYETEIDDLAREHKKEVETLRVFYDQQMADTKKKLHEVVREKESMERTHQSAIDDIRMAYDEKLKMGYKEGLRRQSTTERKSDGARMRQLISEKDSLNTKLLEHEIKYDNDIQKRDERIKQLEKQVAELANAALSYSSNGGHSGGGGGSTTTESGVDIEMEKKLKDLQEQKERLQRRIDYWHEKDRDNSEENPRIGELQQQILDIQNEMEQLKKNAASKNQPHHDDDEKKTPYEQKEKGPGTTKFSNRRGSEQPSRRHTDSVTLKGARRSERDPRKRWSNLEETSEREQSRGSSSVLARKTLWENISTDDPKYTG